MNEWQQEWQQTERDNRLHELATRYHTECEAYDRTVCTGPVGQDVIMPANSHEMALINRNAHSVRKRMMEEAALEGIEREELARAISKWHGSLQVRERQEKKMINEKQAIELVKLKKLRIVSPARSRANRARHSGLEMNKEANSCGQDESDVIPPELLDLVRFMCSTWKEVDKFVYKYCDSSALMHYPVLQGTSNQIKLRNIGEQPCNTKNISAAVEWMQRYNAEVTRA